jgi:hypothetical protein
MNNTSTSSGVGSVDPSAKLRTTLRLFVGAGVVVVLVLEQSALEKVVSMLVEKKSVKNALRKSHVTCSEASNSASLALVAAPVYCTPKGKACTDVPPATGVRVGASVPVPAVGAMVVVPGVGMDVPIAPDGGAVGAIVADPAVGTGVALAGVGAGVADPGVGAGVAFDTVGAEVAVPDVGAGVAFSGVGATVDNPVVGLGVAFACVGARVVGAEVPDTDVGASVAPVSTVGASVSRSDVGEGASVAAAGALVVWKGVGLAVGPSVR